VRSFSFPGTYEDDAGVESVRWRVVPTWSPGWWPGYAVITVIRGIRVRGGDFDRLEPQDRAAAQDVLTCDRGGLTECLLTGELPATLESAGGERLTAVRFELDLRRADGTPGRPRSVLRLSCVLDEIESAVTDDCFEDGLLKLESALPPDVCLRACVTCRYGDYSPAGHGLTGMRCHRDAKAQYLPVRSARDYWDVPVTEEVLETYLCPEYQRRIPGTGHRG
jgi:Family of unknown function (DUF6304)